MNLVLATLTNFYGIKRQAIKLYQTNLVHELRLTCNIHLEVFGSQTRMTRSKGMTTT